MKMKLIAGLKVPPGGFRGRFLPELEGGKQKSYPSTPMLLKENEDEVNSRIKSPPWGI